MINLLILFLNIDMRLSYENICPLGNVVACNEKLAKSGC
jgi:hypothetical protein